MPLATHVAAALLAVFGAARATAELIPWTYSVTVGPPGGPPAPAYPGYAEFAGGGVTMDVGALVATHDLYGGGGPGLGSPHLTLVQVGVQEVTPGGYAPLGQGYAYGLTITDQPSGQSGTLSFRGALSTSVASYFEWSDSHEYMVRVTPPGGGMLVNTFRGPTQQSLVLGKDRYDVTFRFLPGAYVPGDFQGGPSPPR
jgi:hypothetical protein